MTACEEEIMDFFFASISARTVDERPDNPHSSREDACTRNKPSASRYTTNQILAIPKCKDNCQLPTSNNFRWLSTAKEAKILFFVPDINGEKFLLAHATREIFLSYLSPRLRGFPPFVVLSPAWSKLLFHLEHFSHPPFPFRCRARWVLVVRLAEACFDFGFSWLHVQVFPISW